MTTKFHPHSLYCNSHGNKKKKHVQHLKQYRTFATDSLKNKMLKSKNKENVTARIHNKPTTYVTLINC